MDTIADGWVWFAAAAMVLVLVAALAAYYLLRPKRKPEKEIEEEHGTGEWNPTGRIDLTDPQAVGSFVLHAEDTRVIESSGGVEHRQIRWRKATVDEAKRVVMAYHAQRNLTTRANFIVTIPKPSERASDETIERQEHRAEKDRRVEKSEPIANETPEAGSPSDLKVS